jgi:hypothetical protein
MRLQVLSQDLSISHDYLDQDSQVLHALAKKSSTREIKQTKFCSSAIVREFRALSKSTCAKINFNILIIQ